MEGSWESLFDAKKVAKQWPEFRGEKLVSIRHDWIGEAMVSDYRV